MKKIMFALALALMCGAANAQISTAIADAKAAVEAAEAATENAKKASKPATWLKVAQAYMSAYTAPQGGVFVGQSKAETIVVMGKERKPRISKVTIMGQQMEKYAYSTVNVYFAANGTVGMIEIIKPVYKNALAKALDAYKKAYELDTKGQKKKEITAAIEKITKYYTEEAYTAYQVANYKKASYCFENAYKAGVTEPYAKKDIELIFNAGFTAHSAKDFNRAKRLLGQCLKENYYGENGDVFVKLADIASQNEDKEAGMAESKKYLEQGFEKFPQSQGILVGLINYYQTTGDNPDELFKLLDKAKANEPNNASLYYVEGNVHKSLGNGEKAVEAYRKCAQVNPKYEYGYIGEGIYFYDSAIDYQQKANAETDNAKYSELALQFENALKSCIEPFEKAYELTKDANVKKSIAEYLKQACFRFRTTSDDMMAKYEKYAKAVQAQ